MDHRRFDAVSRILTGLPLPLCPLPSLPLPGGGVSPHRGEGSFPSRRDVLRGLAGAGLGIGSLRLADDAAAKKKNNKTKKNGKKRKDQTKTQPPPAPPGCVPEPQDATCAGRCGTRSNNCGQPVTCPCGEGEECLSNGSCAKVCTDNADCTNPCGEFSCSIPSTEGTRHCITGLIQPPVRCTTTADCPLGSHCQGISVDQQACIGLCT